MKALARLEAILQEVMESPQRLLSPRRLHPLELAAAVTRALEGGILPVGDVVLIPNRYTIRLHPADLAEIDSIRRTLEQELTAFVARAAEERGLTLRATPLATIVAGSDARGGSITVDTAFDEGAVTRVQGDLPVTPAMLAGFTERIARPSLPPAAAPLPPAELEVLDRRGGTERRVPLNGAIVTIGRRTGNDIALLDLEVSRQHARIDCIPPRYYVTDLGSTNGTRVNGKAVAGRHPLHSGDVIEIGGARLRFRQGG